MGKSKNNSGSDYKWIVMLVLQILVKVLLTLIKKHKKRSKR